MENLSKKEIKELLGAYGFMNKPNNAFAYGNTSYIGGIELFDNELNGKPFDKVSGATIYFDVKPKGLQITYTRLNTNIRIGVLTENIKWIALESQKAIYEKKDKSVIGRAVVGGLLLGPVGALVGGMSGIGSKNVKVSDYPDNLLSICINESENESEKILVFGFKNKHSKAINNFIANYQDKVTSNEK